MKYASQTTVPVAKSRVEIEEIVTKYKADQFGSAFDNEGHRAMVQFRMNSVVVRFELPLPVPDDKEFTHYVKNGWEYERAASAAAAQYEQACRQRWRALALAIKAKLEAVECGITSFEEEFLAHIVMPDGATFGKWAVPQIERAILENKMPSTLMIAHEANTNRT